MTARAAKRPVGVEGSPGDRWGAGTYVGPRPDLRGMHALIHEKGDPAFLEAQFDACKVHHGQQDRCKETCLTQNWHPFHAADFEVDYWNKVYPLRE